jgi:hypothetical protein
MGLLIGCDEQHVMGKAKGGRAEEDTFCPSLLPDYYLMSDAFAIQYAEGRLRTSLSTAFSSWLDLLRLRCHCCRRGRCCRFS